MDEENTESKKELRKKDAKETVISHEKHFKSINEGYYKRYFNWIIDFLKHFLQTFNDVSKVTEKKVNDLIEMIEKRYSKYELDIDEMAKTAKNEVVHYKGEWPNHFVSWDFFKKDG